MEMDTIYSRLEKRFHFNTVSLVSAVVFLGGYIVDHILVRFST